MEDLIARTFEAYRRLLSDIEQAQSANIRKAAKTCADSLAQKGVIHVYDTGHLVSRELINRVGGLAAMSAFNFSFSVENPNQHRQAQGETGKASFETDAMLVSAAIKRSHMRAGDVLIIGTVSGKQVIPVELAIQARDNGITTIGITSLRYSSQLQSVHPSGKRLFEVVDLVIDNGADYGDAMLEVEGMDRKICPASGIGAAAIMWALVAGIVQEMLARGLQPTVFKSINLPDGPEIYRQTVDDYIRKGY
ncbi:MAG: sugar isomerase domain-containing protein [Chthonomonadetes bacterium]|jgi:uncharacterized phosphosugar-binding protein|nr:sugar isomerase domain-containing protein [Chthonomonadetes bacterium]